MSIRTLLNVFTLAAFAQPSLLLAQSSLVTYGGATANVRMGQAVCYAGDVDDDGWPDFAVGEPGYNGGAGRVVLRRGGYVATGQGAAYLYVFDAPPGVSGMGHALLGGVDCNADGIEDLWIGAPGWNSTDRGHVLFVPGTQTANYKLQAGPIGGRWGWSFTHLGNVDGDIYRDVAMGLPYDDTNGTDAGAVIAIRGGFFAVPGYPFSVYTLLGNQAGSLFGHSVSTSDLNFDGRDDVLVGAPSQDNLFAANSGRVVAFDGITRAQVWSVAGAFGEELGFAVEGGFDFDGDGRSDIFAGSPASDVAATDAGRATMYSGAAAASGQTTVIFQVNGSGATAAFGTSLAFIGDVNVDGRVDVAVGAPGFDPTPITPNAGAVYVYSGETRERLGLRLGGTGDSYGECVASLTIFPFQIGNLENGNLDGVAGPEFLVGCPRSNDFANDGGKVDVLRLYPVAPVVYCTGKVNSAGCVPSLQVQFGTPDVTAGPAQPFQVRVVNLLNQKNGLFFYGLRASATAFQGGTLCVGAPTKRTITQGSGGSTSGSDCTGTMLYDFNALAASGVDPTLVGGQEVFTQAWSRDPASPSTTSLSNAMRFVFAP
jgi:hypothetical protein